MGAPDKNSLQNGFAELGRPEQLAENPTFPDQRSAPSCDDKGADVQRWPFRSARTLDNHLRFGKIRSTHPAMGARHGGHSGSQGAERVDRQGSTGVYATGGRRLSGEAVLAARQGSSVGLLVDHLRSVQARDAHAGRTRRRK